MFRGHGRNKLHPVTSLVVLCMSAMLCWQQIVKKKKKNDFDFHEEKRAFSACIAASRYLGVLICLVAYLVSRCKEWKSRRLLRLYFSLRTKTRVRLGSAEPQVHLRISSSPEETVNVESRGLSCVPVSAINSENNNSGDSSLHHIQYQIVTWPGKWMFHIT